MAEKQKKYVVEIETAVGSCNTNLFKKMASKGDITAEKIENVIGQVVEITGYAMCKITTDDKEFQIGYYATDQGIISTGSQVFLESVEDYFGDDDVTLFKIVKIKTKKGSTYKVSPILADKDTGEVMGE